MSTKPQSAIEARVNEIAAKVKANRAKEESAAAPKKPAKKVPAQDLQLKLELWPDAVRGVPNAILRGALFGVSRERKIHKNRTLVAAVDGYEIRFKGESFNQTDLDVLELMLHIAMPHPLGKKVEFSVHEFLKTLGRGVGKEQHEQFKEQVMRLIAGAVEITDTKAKITFMSTLVRKAYRDEETGRYVVMFDKDILALYESGYTLIDWQERLSLGQNNLAKWLHSFYGTHAAPYPYKVESLQRLSGSTTKQLFKFRQQLRQAFDELVEIGAIKSWAIDENDLVTVKNKPTASQSKHLATKKK